MGQGLSCLSFLLGFVPHVTLPAPALRTDPSHLPPFSAPPSTCSLLLCLPHFNALVPEQPTGALWACPHSAPLGFPCCPQGPPTAPVSLEVPAQVLAGVSVLASAGVCMAWDLLGAASTVCIPWGSSQQVLAVFCLHVQGLWGTCLDLHYPFLEFCGVKGQTAAQGYALSG